MSAITTAMVMAAGHGTRMKPLTNDRSKAMVDVAGLPLIEHMLRRLEEVGIKRAVVNVHAHADHLETYLASRQSKLEIIISDEREAGTVLGLESAGDFDVDEAGRIAYRSHDTASHLYCGVQIFKPALAKGFKEEKFSRKKIWDITLPKGRVFGHVMAGYWMHVGDPQARRFAQAVIEDARGYGHQGAG